VPLGDSITEITCWRSLVWNDLVAAGVSDKIEFVGSMTDNTQNCKSNATDGKFDLHHEGHSGYLAINIANTNLVGWLSTTKPDIIMFMLGTNDVAQGHNTADILAAYTKMVTEMRASNPNVKIIVSPNSGCLGRMLLHGS
jgi:lysophospholipase L1-like esterase